jgi:hypothetical protein
MSRRLILYAAGVLMAIFVLLAFRALIGNAIDGALEHVPGTDQWRVARDVRDAPGLREANENLGLTVEGEREQAQRVETFHTSEVVIRDLTSRAETEARSAPDADTPLDPARADRLRAHDRGLCNASPSVCAPAPAVDP